jgi:hypothetical protein
MAGIVKIEIKIATNTHFEAKPKAQALTDLGKLDLDVLEKLVELSKKPKAIANLKNNFGMIKSFLG